MSEPALNIVAGAGLLFVYTVGWVAGIGYVAWDAERRGLPRWLRNAWTGLALVPMLGLTAYVLVYRRGHQAAPAAAGPQRRRRVTLPRPVAALKRRPHPEAAAAVHGVTTPTAPVSAVAGRRPDPTQASRYVLEALAGPYAGQCFTVHGLPAGIGRGPEAAIRLDADLGVSRRHAELYEQAGVLRLRDTHSSHGTTVNGYTVDDKGLAPGDRIQVGHTLLRLKGEGA